MLGNMLLLLTYACVWRCCAITRAQLYTNSATKCLMKACSKGGPGAPASTWSNRAGLQCDALRSIWSNSTANCTRGLLMANAELMLGLNGLPQCRSRRMSGTTHSTGGSSADRSRGLCHGSPACLLHTEGLTPRGPHCSLGHQGCSIPRCCQQLPRRCSSRMLDTGSDAAVYQVPAMEPACLRPPTVFGSTLYAFRL